MRRYPFVIAGTVAGTAAVLAFPVHKASLHIASASTGSSGTVAGPGTTTAGSAGTPGNPGSSGATTTVPATTGAAAGATTPTTAAASSAVRVATGTDEQFQYGDIAVTVTVEGTKITKVGIASLNEPDGRSASIDSYAVPQLEQQVISAGSANINGVSGATFTSQAFYDSLTSALSKLGIS